MDFFCSTILTTTVVLATATSLSGAAGLANAWRNLAEVSSYAVFAKPPSARSLSALVQSLGGGQGKASFKVLPRPRVHRNAFRRRGP